MFHEQLYGENKLLTLSAWKEFQQMFIESGFEVYFNRELVEIDLPKKMEAEKAADKWRLTVNKLIERTRNAYWRVEERFFKKLSNNYLELLEDKEDFNIVINVGKSPNSKIFQAHSGILKYRSLYFCNQLANIRKDENNIKTLSLKTNNLRFLNRKTFLRFKKIY
ncbi:hypothetical protein C2G38_2228908 [Gigaspora rosea]|uniref:BTB domain-containing protein n=1 Tax=Gigaspora rosea TaxID=44941 RepID=A0A397U3R0_9GLOM|nr:hypothetical protein C2G38_2228908 [Gigaspora rosea]